MIGVLVLARVRRLIQTMVCVTLGLVALGVVEARAAAPSSLGQENVVSDQVPGSSMTGTCTGPSGEGILNFSVSGRAFGPFSGTFTQSGSFTLAGGRVSDFSSTFTITSKSGTVSGREDFQAANAATCGPDGVYEFAFRTGYAATINGSQPDTGTATILMTGAIGQPPLFNESFSPPNGVTLIVPASKGQCRRGGWKSFAIFKGHGDCASFVATGGKNPPSRL